jgi:hypothetical protein
MCCSIHLPVKKDHLKKINIPKAVDDDEMNNILKEVCLHMMLYFFVLIVVFAQLKKKQAEDKKLKDMLKKQGFNTDGMNFGGGMDPDVMEKIMRNINKDQPTE